MKAKLHKYDIILKREFLKGIIAMKKRIFKVLFYVYVIFLVFVIVLKFDGSFEKIISLHHSIIENEQSGIKNINVVPFKSILPYLRNITEAYAFKNIMGNILAFLPLGFFISNKFPKKVIKPIITCFVIIFVIECAQLVFKIGVFDVDDILLNMTGSILGICVNLALYNIDSATYLSDM